MKPHCINLALVQSLSFIANHPMKLCFGIVAENQKIFLLKILVAQIKPQKRKKMKGKLQSGLTSIWFAVL